MEPLLILSPFMWTPEKAGVMSPFRPILGAQEGRGDVATLDSVLFIGDPPQHNRYVAIAPNSRPWKGSGDVVCAATFDFVPFYEGPQHARVMTPFRPLLSPREGRGDGATCDYMFFVGDPPQRKGYIAILSTFGPPRRQGVCSYSGQFTGSKKAELMCSFLILSSSLGTPENARVM